MLKALNSLMLDIWQECGMSPLAIAKTPMYYNKMREIFGGMNLWDDALCPCEHRGCGVSKA
jgi:hypothetical protein